MNQRRRWRPLRWLATCLLACAAGAASADPTPFELDTSSLRAEEIQATRRLLDDAWSRLPAAWSRSLESPIRVQWRSDLPSHVQGRIRGQSMRLQRTLLDDWMRDDDPAALSAVIHELAHLHDRSAAGGLSRDPRLLDLAGWQVRPFRLLPRLGRNSFGDRSPDSYELESPAEFVAVNLEHFVLDASYACRRPALADHFARHFEVTPDTENCASGLPFLAPGETGAAQSLLQLDPDRVYQVDYLLAEGNERLMSHWGHSMLRLVVCAPDRPLGPDCRLDLDHHLVLSFRAFVDDVQISNWRGLTGSYPSRLFVLPLDQVVEEYARTELRGLLSLPLQLEPGEVSSLLQRAAQLHWSYDGRYRFIGNNCAVETFKLLHDGVPRLGAEDLASITPTGLQRRLERAGMLDVSVLKNTDEATRLGYYFPPLSAHYAELFDTARDALGLPYQHLEHWLDLAPEERAGWLTQTSLRAGAALLLLEQAALRREELMARDELKRRFLNPSSVDGTAAVEARAALDELLQLEDFLTRPASLLPDSGYGLPQQAERTALEHAAQEHMERLSEGGLQLRNQARRWLPPQRRATLEGIEANLGQLGEHLRSLHRTQDGLRL
ncbi:DUF7844 domain-containing protein [Luteimonas sp. A478]